MHWEIMISSFPPAKQAICAPTHPANCQGLLHVVRLFLSFHQGHPSILLSHCCRLGPRASTLLDTEDGLYQLKHG